MPLTRDSYGPGSRQPRRLRDFNQIFTEWYDPRRNMTRVRMLQGDCASIEDVVDMIEVLMRIHQVHFELNVENEWHIHFPYMLVEPRIGDKIHNITTDEVYTVSHLGRDPYYQSWDHTCILTGSTAPTRTDRLALVDEDRLLRFRLSYPQESAKDITATDGETGNAEGESWRPTITVRLRRKEPASFGKRPFEAVDNQYRTFGHSAPRAVCGLFPARFRLDIVSFELQLFKPQIRTEIVSREKCRLAGELQ